MIRELSRVEIVIGIICFPLVLWFLIRYVKVFIAFMVGQFAFIKNIKK